MLQGGATGCGAVDRLSWCELSSCGLISVLRWLLECLRVSSVLCGGCVLGLSVGVVCWGVLGQGPWVLCGAAGVGVVFVVCWWGLCGSCVWWVLCLVVLLGVRWCCWVFGGAAGCSVVVLC